MYITMQSKKRNLGLFNLQIQDLIIGGSFGIVFTILFLMQFYTAGIIAVSFGIISLVPMNFSKADRTYKLFFLFTKYLFSIRNYTYFKDAKEVGYV